MKPQLVSATRYSPSALLQIKDRLDNFYGTVEDYSAFATPSNQTHCWEHIAVRIRELVKSGLKVRILEIGAGKSGFGNYLVQEGLRAHCFWTAQDVTQQNSAWLNTYADEVMFGDIDPGVVRDKYDIVFSTFVLEHVVDPVEHLNRLQAVLSPSHGTLFIFCPRYDFPGYLTPSSRHLNAVVRLQFMASSCAARIKTLVFGRPAFLVQNDLAAFYLPFFTDADAVHWVSAIDLKKWALHKKGICRHLKVGKPKLLSKDWIVKRLLTVAVSIQFGTQ